jgi:oxygen-independent coproporphyrinogen-3 oxidase
MEAVGRSARRDEMTMMGLRLTEGIGREAFLRETGGELHAAFAPGKLDALIEAGYLELDGDALRATRSGRQRLDSVLAHLLA